MALCTSIGRQIIMGTLVSVCLIYQGGTLKGQSAVTGYLDAGASQVSGGSYLNTALMGRFETGRIGLEAGVQLDLMGRDQMGLSGASLKGYRNVTVKEFHFQIRGFFLVNSHAGLLNETNTGLLLDKRWPHVNLSLGNEFRSFRFKRKTVEDLGYDAGGVIRENWNLVYDVGYHLMPPESDWGLAISITNLDHFLINQETNPLIRLRGLYRMGSNLHGFSEAWYKSSGSFNLSVNYFGFFIRSGITWDIQVK